MRIVVMLMVVMAAVGGGGWWYLHSGQVPAVQYKTAAVHRGDLVSSIQASGTLEPEEVVDVGAQVAGQIVSFGKDSNGHPIDYRSPVQAGMLLARIDDTIYKSDAAVAQAQYNQAKTAILKAQADLATAQAKLLEAEHNWDRARTLGPSDALSQNDYDMYQADYEGAKAAVALAESEVAEAKDGVPLAQAQLDKANRNLDYCTITSPVNGVVIDRRVNVGQTVVSSLNTPSLFLIARDLSRMQIWVSVNEADVGRIVPGSAVTFTCDTFPDQVFDAKVGKIRWNPTMTQNVVLYTVEVDVDNSKGVLIPYLTAKVQFEVERATDSLIVPNLALRWAPASTDQIAPDARGSAKPADEAPAPVGKSHKERHGTVWIKDGPYVRPVDVKLGVTDRVNTAVVTDQLKDGDEIVTGEVSDTADTAGRNPFLPPAQPRRH
jgi:HlyD family secretion protein